MRQTQFKPGGHVRMNANRSPSRWPPKKCVFCGSCEPLTDEHIYARWTRRFIPRTMKKYQQLIAVSYLDHTDYVLNKRPGDVRDWFVKCVCEKHCNNGWMRRLENLARPILIKLINGEKFRLLPRHQSIIAAWSTMTARVAEYGYSEYVTTHHMQRKYLMKTQLAPKTGWAFGLPIMRGNRGDHIGYHVPFCC